MDGLIQQMASHATTLAHQYAQGNEGMKGRGIINLFLVGSEAGFPGVLLSTLVKKRKKESFFCRKQVWS